MLDVDCSGLFCGRWRSGLGPYLLLGALVAGDECGMERGRCVSDEVPCASALDDCTRACLSGALVVARTGPGVISSADEVMCGADIITLTGCWGGALVDHIIELEDGFDT